MRSFLFLVMLSAPVVVFVAMLVLARLTTMYGTLVFPLIPDELQICFPLIPLIFFSFRLSSPPPPPDVKKDTVFVPTSEQLALPFLLIIGPFIMYTSCFLEGYIAVVVGPERAMVLWLLLGIWPGAIVLPLRLIWRGMDDEPTAPLAALVAIEARRQGEIAPVATSSAPAVTPSAAPAAAPVAAAATATKPAVAPAAVSAATSAPAPTAAGAAQAPAVLEVDPNEDCKGLKAWLKKYGLDKYHDKAAQLATEFEASEVTDLAMLEPEEFDVKLMEGMPKIPKTKFEKAMAELRANA